MNITFMIGNGFDIHLGMSTRYIDMYQGYINSPSNTEVIAQFKDELKKHANNNFETWGDFEMAMANHIANYKNEIDFIQCIRDFKKFMADHLLDAQEIFIDYALLSNKSIVFTELDKSISRFYTDYTPNVVNKIGEIGRKFKGRTYNFIIFNYTEVLDRLINYARQQTVYNEINSIEKVIHVHGKLSEDIVLGIDNPGQLSCTSFGLTPKLERAFIKPTYNAKINQQRVQDAMRVINESDVICVFGMSLGLSDLTWRTAIREWLDRNDNHHLFYFGKSSHKFPNKWNLDEILDEEDEKRDHLLSLLYDGIEDYDHMVDNVHLPLHYSIFNFSSLLKASLQKGSNQPEKISNLTY